MNQHPSVRSLEFPWEALQNFFTIAAPELAVVVDQPSLQTSRISLLILAYNGSTPTVFDNNNYAIYTLTYGCTCLPNSMYSDALARAAVPYQTFRYSITYQSCWRSGKTLRRNRQEAFRYNIACISRSPSRVAPWRNCLDTIKLTICQSRVGSQFVSPLESKSGLKHTGKTPRPEP